MTVAPVGETPGLEVPAGRVASTMSQTPGNRRGDWSRVVDEDRGTGAPDIGHGIGVYRGQSS